MKWIVYALKRGVWTEMESFKKLEQAEIYVNNLRNMYSEIEIKEVKN